VLRQLHRTLGIGAIVFWLAQVVTGIAIEAVWMFDGARYYEFGAQPSAEILGQRLDGVIGEGAKVASLWASGTVPGQMKIFYEDRAGVARVRRLDNRGNSIYDMSATSLSNHEGLLRALTDFHEAFISGQTGNWVVALSGALLCTNLALGLRLALRGRSKLRLDLFARPSGSPSVRRYQLHKAAGLWVVIPALVVVATGTTLAVCKGLPVVDAGPGAGPVSDERSISAVDQRDHAVPTTTRRAIEVALAQNPGSSLSAVSLPATPRGWYEVLLHGPDVMPRFWGTTRVYVSARGEQVLSASAIPKPRIRQVSEAIYPLHCGQIAGLAGRITALCVGLALLTVFLLGFVLWRTRRTARRTSRGGKPTIGFTLGSTSRVLERPQASSSDERSALS
jgi:uncharacterized iron-regulated membrane protein